MLADAACIPPAITLTGGSRDDVTQLVPLLEALPPVRGKHVRSSRRTDAVLADRGYIHDQYRRLVRRLAVKPLIAHRDTARGSGPGIQRRFVERVFACLHWFRRLRTAQPSDVSAGCQLVQGRGPVVQILG
ncbi:transposase [Streptomyces tauricus]